jgi:glucoamylase
LLAPHIGGQGANNSGYCAEIGGVNLLRAQRADTHLIMGCSSGFSRRSVGYVGASDGWQDLMRDYKMDWGISRRGEWQHRAHRRSRPAR